MARELPGDWSKRRRDVYIRDDRQCWNCGRYQGMRGLKLHAHHIRPREHGGTHELRNLVTVCNRCHHQIHHGSVENPSHDNPLDQAIETVRGMSWQVKNRFEKQDLLKVVRSGNIPSLDSLQAHLQLVDRAEDVGFSPRSFSDIMRDLRTHNHTEAGSCNTI